ncbi:MAG: endolytic transglycosylase MltG [Micrococcales bacterium]|nr:endolytic transglycosylase MltG [Micrococcales bacterium]
MNERRTQRWAGSGLLDGRSAGAARGDQYDDDQPRRSRRELRETRREPASSSSSYRPLSTAPVEQEPRRQRGYGSSDREAEHATPPRGYRPVPTGPVETRPAAPARSERPPRRAAPDRGPDRGVERVLDRAADRTGEPRRSRRDTGPLDPPYENQPGPAPVRRSYEDRPGPAPAARRSEVTRPLDGPDRRTERPSRRADSRSVCTPETTRDLDELPPQRPAAEPRRPRSAPAAFPAPPPAGLPPKPVSMTASWAVPVAPAAPVPDQTPAPAPAPPAPAPPAAKRPAPVREPAAPVPGPSGPPAPVEPAWPPTGASLSQPAPASRKSPRAEPKAVPEAVPQPRPIPTSASTLVTSTADEPPTGGWAALDKTGSAEKPKRPQKKHRARTVVVMTVVLGMLLGVGYIVLSWMHIFDDKKVSDYAGPGETPVDIVVNKGDVGAVIATTLYEADVVASRKAFIRVCTANPDCASIQPGTYSLKTHMSAAGALSALLDRTNRKSGRVTIPEGLTVAQIKEKVVSNTKITPEAFDAAIADPKALGIPEQFWQVDGINPDEHPERIVEGWLAAGTYDVASDATAVQVLKQMVERTTDLLKAKDVPVENWHTVLITASIIEREVNKDEYRGKVARAVGNRLSSGTPLQADATTAYSLDTAALRLTKEQLADTTNPYNTRVVRGLPPGAIGSPGVASIEAVLDPPEGNWVYWCTVNLDTGETKFTADYNEFQQFKRELIDWLKDNDYSPDGG